MYDRLGRESGTLDFTVYGREHGAGFRGWMGCPFRYPGQYADAETGLYYNRFRYYDPEAGQYISQDPIGLAGGNPTLYGYVEDVSGEVDVYGLSCNTAFDKKKTITDRWVNRLSGKSDVDVDQYLRGKGFSRSRPQSKRRGAIQHTVYTRRTKAGATYSLDYHPGAVAPQSNIHGTPYWKVYKVEGGSKVVYGRIAPSGFKNYDQITDSPLYIDKILVNG